MIKANWGLQFALRIEADEESDIAMLAEIALERLRAGELDGRGNHCAGVYEFSTVEWAHGKDDDNGLDKHDQHSK